MNDAWGSRVDFITSNATKADGNDRKVVQDRDPEPGYAKGNLIGNHFGPLVMSSTDRYPQTESEGRGEGKNRP